MKNVYSKKLKSILILLFGVFLLFVILSGLKLLPDREGMDVPQCDVDNDSELSCYNSVQPDNYNDDLYILKSKIVPPTSTACPTKLSTDAAKYLDDKTADVQNIQNSSSSSSSSSSVTNNINNTNNTVADVSKNTPSGNDPYGYMITQNTNTINDLKGTISQMNQNKPKDPSCPPCPACDRCPEPAFDCKKVPNYRSSAIGQLLPMPILNDFSTF